MKRFPGGGLSRGAWLSLLGAIALASHSHGEAPEPGTIPVTAINHMVIKVSDLERSLKWYQGLFGLPIVARQGDTVILQIGDGPQFLAIADGHSSKPGIASLGLAAKDFDADNVVEILKAQGISSRQERKHEVSFGDPAGIDVRLQDGTLPGNPNRPEPAPNRSLLSLRDFNHFTIFVPDAKRNVQFYQQLFGLGIDTYQGPMPIIRVGPGNQFLAFVGGRSKPYIHHACFTVEKFDPDRILGLLADYGVKPRTNKRGAAGPLESYVTKRMPNRGGAVEGTPELYLTDPDGILLQIQDVRYSGGGGYLGNKRGVAKIAR
ncbi:MAG: VOC family protein [Verrucomicrobiia bacterium]|jgi:catechol 2,3-dioxygenase-like lactoylglutathione lyase family enzyme